MTEEAWYQIRQTQLTESIEQINRETPMTEGERKAIVRMLTTAEQIELWFRWIDERLRDENKPWRIAAQEYVQAAHRIYKTVPVREPDYLRKLETVTREFEQSMSLAEDYRALILRFLDTPEKIREWFAWLTFHHSDSDFPPEMARRMTEAAVHIGRGKVTVATPWYWEEDRWNPKVEAQTLYGHRVQVPRRCFGDWKMLKIGHEMMTARGLDPLAGIEQAKEIHPIGYDTERVFYEIYEPDL